MSFNIDNLDSQKGKLACLMFADELQRRLNKAGSKVIAVSCHPGVSKTNLFSNIPKFIQVLMTLLMSIYTHPPKKAALPMLYAVLKDDVKGGDYFGPTGFKGMKGEPGKVNSKPHSKDKDVAIKLWGVSEKLTGEKFEVNK